MPAEEEQLDLAAYLSRNIVPATSHAHEIPLLLLTCMDSRYPHRIIDTMDTSGWRGKYDQLILAGASLGVVHKKHWGATFLDHLEFAIEEHKVSQLLILDHRDCGAYRKFLGVKPDDPAKEKTSHLEQSRKAIEVITDKFPQLKGKIQCLLLPIETVEKLV
jgi:carbonic anhydrase